MIAWPRFCSCGAIYDKDEWSTLPFCGVMDDGDTGWLLLRNCKVCDSTMSVPTDDPNATGVAA